MNTEIMLNIKDKPVAKNLNFSLENDIIRYNIILWILLPNETNIWQIKISAAIIDILFCFRFRTERERYYFRITKPNLCICLIF